MKLAQYLIINCACFAIGCFLGSIIIGGGTVINVVRLSDVRPEVSKVEYWSLHSGYTDYYSVGRPSVTTSYNPTMMTNYQGFVQVTPGYDEMHQITEEQFKEKTQPVAVPQSFYGGGIYYAPSSVTTGTNLIFKTK